MYNEDATATDMHKGGNGARGDRAPPVPDKFLDQATGQIRVEALLRSYLDLERRMAGMVKVPCEGCAPTETQAFHRALGVPDHPAGYRITARHELLTSDPAINQRLHAAGFTPAQAQLVYDLAHDHVLPVLREVASHGERQGHLHALKEHFGGEYRFRENARQIAAWGKAHLPAEAYAALSSTADGVKTMQRMMSLDEPSLGRSKAPNDEGASEEELKKMMRDPRYWKTRDPAFIGKVTAGFRRLYGDD
jgi:hypothetical protein